MCRRTPSKYQEVFTSSARTATSTATLANTSTGGLFVIDCTAATATPSVVFTINGVDALSGKTWTILTSAAITGTGTTILRIHPALTAATNTIAKDFLPATFNVTATHADTDSITYTVSFLGIGDYQC